MNNAKIRMNLLLIMLCLVFSSCLPEYNVVTNSDDSTSVTTSELRNFRPDYYCDDIYHGEIKSIFLYSASQTSQTCEGQLVEVKCFKGSLQYSDNYATYKYESCTESNYRYEQEEVSYGSECIGADVQRVCTDNSCGDWIPNYSFISCKVADAPVVTADPGLVVNGILTDTTEWTIDPGWSIVSGEAIIGSVAYSGNEWLKKNTVLTVGKLYEISFSISNYTQGSLQIDSWYPDYTEYLKLFSANGTYTYQFRAAITDLSFMASANSSFTLNNIILNEVVEKPAVESNLALNGTFSDTSAWTLDQGWQITNGKATIGAVTYSGNEWLKQNGILAVGKLYEISFSISNYRQGSLQIDSWYPDYTEYLKLFSANGTYTYQFRAAKTDLTFMASANSSFELDDVIINEIVESVIPPPDTTTTTTTTDTSGQAYTVVPGVYGFGTDTRAAYGKYAETQNVADLPKILHVNTLKSGISSTDATHGSFEWAVTRSFPRIVVFDISGVIDGVGFVEINYPYITIAGQSAPGHIVFNGEGFYVNAKDVLIQHMTFRNKSTADKDCITVNNYAGKEVNGVVIDHISCSWATDELVSFGQDTSADVRNITLSNSILAECLLTPSSSGTLVDVPNLSIIGNLYAHNNKRHPSMNDRGQVAFYNNVVYNYGYAIAEFNGLNNSSQVPIDKIWINFIGNYVKSGTNSHYGRGLVLMDLYAGQTTNHISMRDNWHDGIIKTGLDIDTSDYSWPYTVVPELVVPNYVIKPVNQVLDHVIANAGARPADRDSVDRKVIQDVLYRTGSHIPISAAPAVPNYSVVNKAFVPVSNPHNMPDGSSYTNIELQLHQLSKLVEGK